jgi:transposase
MPLWPLVVEEARTVVQQAAVINLDETDGREEQHRARLWTVVTAPLTVFRIDRTRSRAAAEAPLTSDFMGTVGPDRWSDHGRFPAERRALC